MSDVLVTDRDRAVVSEWDRALGSDLAVLVAMGRAEGFAAGVAQERVKWCVAVHELAKRQGLVWLTPEAGA